MNICNCSFLRSGWESAKKWRRFGALLRKIVLQWRQPALLPIRQKEKNRHSESVIRPLPRVQVLPISKVWDEDDDQSVPAIFQAGCALLSTRSPGWSYVPRYLPVPRHHLHIVLEVDLECGQQWVARYATVELGNSVDT